MKKQDSELAGFSQARESGVTFSSQVKNELEEASVNQE